MSKFRLVFGLAVVLCAMATSTASSLGASFFPTTKQGAEKAFEAKQKTVHVFTVNGQKVECAKVIFSGKSPPAKGSSVIKVLPTYEECTFAGEKAKVTNEGCEYEFNSAIGGPVSFSSSISIDSNKVSQCHIVIVATLFGISCTVTVQSEASNQLLKIILYQDLTGRIGVRISGAVAGITYTASGGGCGLAGISSGKEAKYTGEVETEAFALA